MSCIGIVYIFDSSIDALEDFKCKTTETPLCQTLEQIHIESQSSKGSEYMDIIYALHTIMDNSTSIINDTFRCRTFESRKSV